MATNPQPPLTLAPAPPRAGRGNYVIIALLLLALIVVAGCMGVWMGLHFVARAVRVSVDHDRGRKEVSIKTPLGSLEVNHDLKESSLGLPLYPGAIRLTDQDSATVNIDIADAAKVRVLVGKFATPDSLDKVRAFYHDRLGDQVTQYKERDAEGKTDFEIRHGKQDKVVNLARNGDRTVIQLVRVSEGPPEAN